MLGAKSPAETGMQHLSTCYFSRTPGMATLTKPSVLVTAIKKPMDLQHFFQLVDMLGKKFRRNTRNADKKYKKPHNWTDLAWLI